MEIMAIYGWLDGPAGADLQDLQSTNEISIAVQSRV